MAEKTFSALSRLSKTNLIICGVVFGLKSASVICYNLYKYLKNEITLKDLIVSSLCDVGMEGVNMLSTTSFAFIGSLIGSAMVPVVGTFIGGFIGGLIGNQVSKKCIEPLLRKIFVEFVQTIKKILIFIDKQMGNR